MGLTRPARPVAMMAAVFSRHLAAMQWARDQLERQYGSIDLSSEPFPFVQTDYYERQMGAGVQKQFHLVRGLADPSALPDWKQQTNDWERQLTGERVYEEVRPLNIDPGYVTEAKLVLATTKDRDHRIYLRDDIYAEVTLYYHAGKWRERPWTYPDYLLPDTIGFLDECRLRLRRWYREQPPT